MMQDIIFSIGLGIVTFSLGMLWFLLVSRNFFFQNRRVILTFWGGFCVVMTVFFLIVSVFHLGHTLFGWMVKGP